MSRSFSGTNRRRGVVMIMFTLMITTLILPLVGLAIDLTMLYTVQAKLSAAVDGAALGAGRLLGTNANTTEIANEFLQANFPNGFWNATLRTPTIDFNNIANAQTIRIVAQADVPLMFLRIFQPSSIVAASATATRRNTRVVLVIDKSTSMSQTVIGGTGTVFAATITAGKTFVDRFTPNLDELGFVLYGSSGIVAYPNYTLPYNPDPTSAGGPDGAFLTTNSTPTQPAAGPMIDQMNYSQYGGYTGISDGLSLAFVEIQKAHNRDLAIDGSDVRQNAIVLMTDGYPNHTSVVLNQSGASVIASASPCSYKSTSTPSQLMIGAIGDMQTTSLEDGLHRLLWRDGSTTTRATIHSTSATLLELNPRTPTNGCALLSKTPSRLVAYRTCPVTPCPPRPFTNYPSDVTQIPPADYWGNDLTGAGYVYSKVVKYSSATHSSYVVSPNPYYNGTALDRTKVADPAATAAQQTYHMALVAWNSTDGAGQRIRSDTTLNTKIFTIGYIGSDGADEELLKRLANVKGATSYDQTKPVGKYYAVYDGQTLAEAYNDVASELLRLAE